MTCNCMEDIKQKVTAFICEQKGIDPANVIETRFDNKGYNLTENSLKDSLNIPMTITHRWTTKGGKEKETKLPTYVTCSFCPFCGKAVE